MVKAEYIVDKNKHTLSVTGHAEYSEYGKDIVCAGVSAITHALMVWAKKHPNTVEYINIESGNVIITCVGSEDVSAVFYMAAVGIEQIANTYPNNVEIDIIGYPIDTKEQTLRKRGHKDV